MKYDESMIMEYDESLEAVKVQNYNTKGALLDIRVVKGKCGKWWLQGKYEGIEFVMERDNGIPVYQNRGWEDIEIVNEEDLLEKTK